MTIHWSDLARQNAVSTEEVECEDLHLFVFGGGGGVDEVFAGGVVSDGGDGA